MNDFQIGDLITFHLRGEQYGLAQIVHIENLSLYDHYHLAIRDAVLDAGPGGVDQYGDPFERSHDLSGVDDAATVVDHLAVTFEAFLASEPMIVGQVPIAESDLDGYQVFLHLMRKDAVRRGLLRSEEVAEVEDEELGDEEIGDEEIENGDMEYDVVDDGGENPTATSDEGADGVSTKAQSSADTELVPIEAHTWHTRVFEVPVGDTLFELHDIFSTEKFSHTTLGGFINSYFDGSRVEEIEQLVNQFIGGDYGAGHELLAFGSAAAEALGKQLAVVSDPELADDILRILADTGAICAYELVADFFVTHGAINDPLYQSAARGLCYAVMLTGGSAVPLRPHLLKISEITDPDLRNDVNMAVEAMENAPPEEQTVPKTSTSNPFGTLGV